MQAHTPPLQRLLLTGAAGFIGFHLARRLLTAGWRVVGVDANGKFWNVDCPA